MPDSEIINHPRASDIPPKGANFPIDEKSKNVLTYKLPLKHIIPRKKHIAAAINFFDGLTKYQSNVTNNASV